ncbi:hypothetical protein MASR1M8_10220 [Thermomonas brevis]
MSARDGLRIAFRDSLAGKLTLGGIVLVLAVVALLYGITRAGVARHGEQALQAAVDTDLAGLADIQASGGTGELRARIGDRIALEQGDDAGYYLLVDAAGTPLAGNLRQWPRLEASRSEAGYFPALSGRELLGRATLLADGARLLVARDTAPVRAVLGSLRTSFLVAGLAATVLALAAGMLAARRLRNRLQAISGLHDSIERNEQLPPLHPPPGRDEIDRLTRQTQHMVARLTELIAAHRDVSDHTAHEIRTPLLHLDHSLIRTLEATDDPRVVEPVVKARGEVRSVIRMLESLLDIAGNRARIGDASGLEDVDLSGLIADLAELYRDSADEAGFELVTRIAPEVHLRADAMQLRRLVSNLLDNAFKYCPPGTRINIELQPGPHLLVQDDGPGIPPADRERIFEKFSRVAGIAHAGHGLGLALAAAIAERHGLQLRLEPSPSGARFVLSPRTSP